MQLERIVATSAAVAATRSRTRKLEHLAELLGALDGGELSIATSYLMGELPQGKIGLGYAALRDAALQQAAHPDASAGVLDLTEVHSAFERIAHTRGAGSGKKRMHLLRELLGRATAEEHGFLLRLVAGELRQGALQGLMADAIARASGVEAPLVRRAIMLAGNVPEVATVALAEGAAGLQKYRIQLFRPLLPMLAQSGESTEDILARLGTCAFETKLDGARVLVHRDGSRVVVFSRRGNDVTAAVPEVVEAASSLPVNRVLLDGEAIALSDDGGPQPFQVTMRRFGRRLDVERMRRELPLAVFFFDCLLLDERELLDAPARERVAALEAVVPPQLRVGREIVTEPEAGEVFLAEALRRGHEGVVAKSLDAPYEAGRRGAAWLKLKPAHTVDLVVLAAEWGSGRRQGWLSNLHLGARDDEGTREGESGGSSARWPDGFVMLGKTFKGLTDAMLAWQTQRLRELATEERGNVVYVRPELVVEIVFDGLQESPHYPGGLALRFARVKAHRPDKRPEEADTLATLRKWAQQR